MNYVFFLLVDLWASYFWCQLAHSSIKSPGRRGRAAKAKTDIKIRKPSVKAQEIHETIQYAIHKL